MQCDFGMLWDVHISQVFVASLREELMSVCLLSMPQIAEMTVL